MLATSLFITAFCFLFARAEDWATYPQVPKTASINGFADPIIDLLPQCAKECVKFPVNNTPCPYWDTGCFCVMPQWAGLVGQCIALSCSGDDVASATFLATSLCSTVGANTWMMPASISTMLSTAAGNAREVTTISGMTPMSWVIGPGSSASTGTVDVATETGTAAASSATTSATTASGSSSATNIAVLQTASFGLVTAGFLLSWLF
ncbi:uncharacterized protein LODBEIA_P49650 [Lodderomyces beijingensis]|uniref:CFEM domain-containing protein n=1 Tax=Lodderomyces beijingensis TaxID=1775926 RepID=A0ABP0ZUT0_9ASCO